MPFWKWCELELLGVNMNKIILVSVCLVAISEIVVAKVACNEKTTSDIEACAKENFDEADQELNAYYRGAMKKLTGANKSNLLETQRYWNFIRLDIVMIPSIRRAPERRRELINGLA
jgi:uncharacterized protein YecT (DUF1311 family)